MRRVDLPWPPRQLMPNGRWHWATRARAAAAHRKECLLLCQAVGLRALLWPAATVSLTFCPPDKRRRDLDGMLSSAKQLLDALAEATGIDDSRFALTIAKGEPVKGGRVLVEISQPAPAQQQAGG